MINLIFFFFFFRKSAFPLTSLWRVLEYFPKAWKYFASYCQSSEWQIQNWLWTCILWFLVLMKLTSVEIKLDKVSLLMEYIMGSLMRYRWLKTSLWRYLHFSLSLNLSDADKTISTQERQKQNTEKLWETEESFREEGLRNPGHNTECSGLPQELETFFPPSF